MKAIEYLESLIAGQKVSEIPVQVSELNLLKMLLEFEQLTREISTQISTQISVGISK